ncbi:uncharacterized protein LOC112590099 [Harpegnathos saltator]|uniref:uncharacterized protein LOC112590099 n=1 Tax=Harpegnathos saltator TaxID=610380 RepID=UPI000DBED8A9|nr:uncharacterized protein LOC112590099 [Harpegnathos saltator]
MAFVHRWFEIQPEGCSATQWKLKTIYSDCSCSTNEGMLRHNPQKILAKIKYNEHQWKICGDLKVIGLLIEMQSGFTKFCCFLCLWDSRAIDHHYVKKDWPSRSNYEPGKQNVSSAPLVNPQDIFLQPLHIKLGRIKNFVKALNHEGRAFQYLIKLFPKLSYAKIKEGIFLGPDIRKLMADENFTKCLTPDEAAAWHHFKVLFTLSR